MQVDISHALKFWNPDSRVYLEQPATIEIAGDIWTAVCNGRLIVAIRGESSFPVALGQLDRILEHCLSLGKGVITTDLEELLAWCGPFEPPRMGFTVATEEKFDREALRPGRLGGLVVNRNRIVEAIGDLPGPVIAVTMLEAEGNAPAVIQVRTWDWRIVVPAEIEWRKYASLERFEEWRVGKRQVVE